MSTKTDREGAEHLRFCKAAPPKANQPEALVPVEASEREKFEAWYGANYGGALLRRAAGDRYYYKETQHDFVVWMACAASRALVAVGVEPTLTRHKFWGAGEADCPQELKGSNGELHTIRCKVCGDNWRRSVDVCFGAGGSVGAEPAGTVDCEDCGGRGVVGEARYLGDFQPPEHDPCDSCGGSGKWMAEPAAAVAILKGQLNACAASLKSYQETDESAAQRIETAQSLLFHAHKLALRVRPAQGELTGTIRQAREALAAHPLQAQDAAPVGPTTEDQLRRLAILNAFMIELDSRLRMGESHGDGKVSTKMLRDLLDNLFKAAPPAGVQGDAAREGGK